MNEMFIKLSDIDLRIIKRAEQTNCRKYIEKLDCEYITPYQLFSCIDDLQDNYTYLEEKVSDLTNALNEKEDNIPGLEKSLQKELNKVKEENKYLKEQNELLKEKAIFYSNEDMLDRLADEGVEL